MAGFGWEKHVVPCAHCGRDVLDHMTQCPFCGGVLAPRGYRGANEENMKKIKRAANIIGFALAIALIAWLLIGKTMG